MFYFGVRPLSIYISVDGDSNNNMDDWLYSKPRTWQDGLEDSIPFIHIYFWGAGIDIGETSKSPTKGECVLFY